MHGVGVFANGKGGPCCQLKEFRFRNNVNLVSASLKFWPIMSCALSYDFTLHSYATVFIRTLAWEIKGQDLNLILSIVAEIWMTTNIQGARLRLSVVVNIEIAPKLNFHTQQAYMYICPPSE